MNFSTFRGFIHDKCTYNLTMFPSVPAAILRRRQSIILVEPEPLGDAATDPASKFVHNLNSKPEVKVASTLILTFVHHTFFGLRWLPKFQYVTDTDT
jgi:hypothetical protein